MDNDPIVVGRTVARSPADAAVPPVAALRTASRDPETHGRISKDLIVRGSSKLLIRARRCGPPLVAQLPSKRSVIVMELEVGPCCVTAVKG